MIKKLFALIFVVLLCAAPISCSKPDSELPEGMKLASNDISGYLLYVPEDWVVDMSTGVTSAYHSVADSSNVSVIVSSLNSTSITPDEYWDSYKTQYTETLPDLEEVETSNLILDGIHAKSYVFTATMSQTKYKFMQVIAIRGADAYIFTFTSTEDNYDKHIETVDNILVNFKIK